MKSKVLVVTLLCVMGLIGLSIGNAEAGQWYPVTITQCGTTYNNYFLSATPAAGTGTPFPANTLFVISPTFGGGKEMLASALTAYSNSGQAWIYLEAVTSASQVFGVWASPPTP